MSKDPSEAGFTRRQILRGLAAVGVASTGPANSLLAAKSPNNPVIQENQRPGTRDWMLQRHTRRSQVALSLSLDRGLLFSPQRARWRKDHVSCQHQSGLSLYARDLSQWILRRRRRTARQAVGRIRRKTAARSAGGSKRVRNCEWEACAELQIPHDWLSGVYVGKLTALGSGLQSYVIFIVRDDRPADFIFQCSDNTWQAYNRWPDQYALYDDGQHEWYWGGDVQVSFHRPYGKYCQILDAPLSLGSGEWFLWEFPLAYWMESLGYDVTYISNLDTHRDRPGSAPCAWVSQCRP